MATFNFGHASKWDKQQMLKKTEEVAVKISEEVNPINDLKNAMKEYERKMVEAAVKAQEAEQRRLEAEAEEKANAEWIWVEGYKGTNKDMTCRDYQFEINKQFDMPEGADIEDCKSGFHFCKDLKDVFSYYKVGEGHRFFKVHALVRKTDYETYGKAVKRSINNPFYYACFGSSSSSTTTVTEIRDKLTSKSIVFLRELTTDEVFGSQYVDCDGNVWTAEDKALAMEHNFDYVRNMYKARTLVNLGYSEAFAKYIVEEGHYKAAYAAGTQEGLSMDMKVAFILREDC